MDIAGINPIIAIIIGLLLIGLVFRIIKGVITASADRRHFSLSGILC